MFFRIYLLVYLLCISNLGVTQDYHIELVHNYMETKIGKPAIITPYQSFPAFRINSEIDGYITGEIIFLEKDTIIDSFEKIILQSGERVNINFDNQFSNIGNYRVNFAIESSNNNREEDIYYESFYFTVSNQDQLQPWNSIVVHPDKNGNLRYVPDYRGNHIPDYSPAGYMGGGVELPKVPTEIILEPKPGDDTKRIQEAIDKVSSIKPDNNGFRGAVLLKKGVYEISDFLEIDSGGIVLRGEGTGDYEKLLLDLVNDYSLNEFKNILESVDATLLLATGKKRRTLIRVSGDSGAQPVENTDSEIVDQYVPVGAKSFKVEKPELFDVGDNIIIQRRGNMEWIGEIGMDEITIPDEDGPTYKWEPFNLEFENTITAIEGNMITVENTIFNAIESVWGGGKIYKYEDEGRIEQVGIENIRAISFWKPDKYGSDGTKHAHRFLSFVNAKNSWVKNVVMEHFIAPPGGGALTIDYTSKQITINNSSNLIADDKYYSGPGYRNYRTNIETDVEVARNGFYPAGQAVLVMNCYTLNNRHSFTVTNHVSGPNVFLDCEAENSLATSEPHHRWSAGGLYDNVADNIAFMNRLNIANGHGWGGANYVAWNTQGTLINEQPPTAQNWAIGHKGEIREGRFYDYHGRDGYCEKTGSYLRPRSLYIQQIIDRKGKDVLEKIDFKSMKQKIEDADNKVQNYPNPADNYTVFTIRLENSSKIILSVYSLDGRQLAKMDYGKKNEGYHEIYWQTKDNNGNRLPNGMYIYQFRTTDGKLSNKLIICR